MAADDLRTRGLDVAERSLTENGYTVLSRNWSCPDGDIDLVAIHGGSLVFVEVKTRTSTRFGHPFEAITPGKLSRLPGLAAAWLADHGPVKGATRLRVDAIAILLPHDSPATIEHLVGIF